MRDEPRRESWNRPRRLPWQFVVAALSLSVGFIGLCNSIPGGYRVRVFSPITAFVAPSNGDEGSLSGAPTVPELFVLAQPPPQGEPAPPQPASTNIEQVSARTTAATSGGGSVQAAADSSTAATALPTSQPTAESLIPAAIPIGTPPPSTTPAAPARSAPTAASSPTAHATAPPVAQVMTMASPTPVPQGRVFPTPTRK